MRLLWLAFGILQLSSLAFAQTNNSVVVTGNARFTIISPTLIRLEYSTKSKFIDNPSLFAANRSVYFEDSKIRQTPTETVIDTGSIVLTYKPDGKPFSDKNLSAVILGNIQWHPSMKNIKNLGGTTMCLDDKEGEIPVGDGVLSRDGWYVLDDSQRLILENRWVAKRPEGSGADWYLFGYGTQFKKALKDLTLVGGAVPIPRRYVLGSWFSRWWPYTSNDYRKIVQEYHDHDFPLDVLVMDMDWHKPDNFTGYTWNRKLFPDAEDYLTWIHHQHLFATLNDHPQGGVGPYEERFPQFMKEMGRDPGEKDPLPYDLGNKKYMQSVFQYTHEPLERMGVDFWWLDYLGDTEAQFNHLGWANEFYFQHSRLSGLRGQQFSRWGDWGDHRHPVHFSGDAVISFKTLKFEVPFTAESGNVGLFFWSHDMGGFEGKRNPEALARWVQFGAFSAALRIHSFNKKELDKRPWVQPKNVEDSMRISYHLRSEFFPYTYSRAAEASFDSVPLIRPLYVEYPEIEAAYSNNQEYLYGHDILVAPIVEKGKGFKNLAEQKVWFPPGIWYDWFSGQVFAGNTSMKFSLDLNSFPLFIRGGVPLTLQPYSERMTTDPLKTLVVRVYPGEEGVVGHSQLYEDDGLTERYRVGSRGVTQLSYVRHGTESRLEISGTTGGYIDQLPVRSYQIEFYGFNSHTHAFVNGIEVRGKFDSGRNLFVVDVPAQDIRKGVKVRVF